MSDLASRRCEACRAGAPVVPDEQIGALLSEIPGWELIEIDGVRRLRRSFGFRNFAEALAFTNAVGAIAEDAMHHPELVTGWGEVTVSWWTHKIRGLHMNDFIMAARTDELVPDTESAA